MKIELMKFDVMNANGRIYREDSSRIMSEMSLPLLRTSPRDMTIPLGDLIGTIEIAIEDSIIYGDMHFYSTYQYMEEIIESGGITTALSGTGVMHTNEYGEHIVDDFTPLCAFISDTNAWFKPHPLPSNGT